jgi:hypothetical protein
MNLAAFYSAGYAAVPLRGGRPCVAGVLTNNPSWRYHHGDDRRFADCDVGLLCSARPLHGASGPATFAAVSSTWISGVRWETRDRKLGAELAAIVERIAGQGPTRTDGPESLRVFRVDRPFVAPRLPPMYLPKERYRELSYQPHRFEVQSIAGLLTVSGGQWTGGALPDTPRDALPTLTIAQAGQIISDVQAAFTTRGALPWV